MDTSGTNHVPMYDEFRAGVTACLRSWSALRAAVQGGWGGNESLSKAEDLRSNILGYFDGSACSPKSLSIDDLEDNLAIYMEEEFSVVLEDNSERQVADTIWRMYENCMKGDASLARQIVEITNKVMEQSSQCPVQVQSQDEEEDDDEMMDTNEGDGNSVGMEEEEDAFAPPLVNMGTVPTTTTSASEYASQYLFGPPRSVRSVVNVQPVRQLGETSVDEPIIPVDEDGFAPVVKRKGRKN